MSHEQPTATPTPQLMQGDDGLALVAGNLRLRGDFTPLLRRTTERALAQEPLVRAVRVKGAPAPLSVVDATAGLGEDAFILAASGAHVTLFEHDEVIAALLEDALARAAKDAALAPIVARMRLVKGESATGLGALESAPSVVYLDPMFPAKKKAALTNKKLQLFRMLEAPAVDEEALMSAAIAAATKKVVVKRPAKGQHLAGIKPSYSLTGKTVRFDVIVCEPPRA